MSTWTFLNVADVQKEVFCHVFLNLLVFAPVVERRNGTRFLNDSRDAFRSILQKWILFPYPPTSPPETVCFSRLARLSRCVLGPAFHFKMGRLSGFTVELPSRDSSAKRWKAGFPLRGQPLTQGLLQRPLKKGIPQHLLTEKWKKSSPKILSAASTVLIDCEFNIFLTQFKHSLL